MTPDRSHKRGASREVTGDTRQKSQVNRLSAALKVLVGKACRLRPKMSLDHLLLVTLQGSLKSASCLRPGPENPIMQA